MKVVVIYGSERKQSTYQIAQQLLTNLAIEPRDLKEFFLPKDMNQFCVGCLNCVMKGEEFCPHYVQVKPILEAILQADLLVFTTPVYVMRASGQMKVLLDHFPYLYMVHRPRKEMFSKSAVVIATAAGGGMKSAMKDIQTSLKYWGVSNVFTYGKAVRASKWSEVSEEKRNQIAKETQKLAEKIKKSSGKKRAKVSVKVLFTVFRGLQKSGKSVEKDAAYWEEKEWLKNKRPWK